MATDYGKAGMALTGASIGFAIGGFLVWQGCGQPNLGDTTIMFVCLGGAVFAILGAILGSLFG